MIVLAVDTCLEPGSVALLREGGPSYAKASEGVEPEVVPLPPGWRSTALHEEILRLLAQHKLSTAEIDLYAVTAGPGAFTGVRLGLTAVKGLAEVHDKPVVAVSTLEALAAAAVVHPSRDRKRAVAKDSDKWQVTSDKSEEPPEGSLVTRHSSLVTAFAPVLDARRGQVFGAVYQNADEGLRPVLPETVCALPSFLEQVQAAGLKEVRFCATDWTPFLADMERAGWSSDSLIQVSPLLAGIVAQMAVVRFQQGRGIAALTADANYVRASDAELFWKE